MNLKVGKNSVHELSIGVVVPTRNEAGNVAEIIRRLKTVLSSYEFEIIFVDDNSFDGTAELVKKISRDNSHVRCLHRIGRRGLSSAVIEGILASSCDIIVVMDGDLQHDETKLPAMIAELQTGNTSLVIASRYIDTDRTDGFDHRRLAISRAATKIAQRIFVADLSDPMSGFFAIRRETFMMIVPYLSGTGFKILLDIVISSPVKLKISEIPFKFRNRTVGESKLDSVVAAELIFFLIEKKLKGIVSARFLKFATVGLTGLLVNLSALGLFMPLGFFQAKIISSIAAMTSNFFLNNFFTYRDCRLIGGKVWIGLFKFYLVCSIGLVAEVGIASFTFYEGNIVWWLAALAGIVVGTFWNYQASRIFAWRVN